MIRKLLIAFGLFEVLRPRPIIDACERIGLENPEEAELRSIAVELARLEGIVVVWLLWRRGKGSRPVAVLLGLVGLVAVLLPEPLIRLTQRVAYRNADDLVLRTWVKPAARALGALYLLISVLAWRSDEQKSTNS